MQIVIDLDTRKPQRSLTDSRTATQFDFKRGDDAVLEILFVRAGVQTQLTVGIALTFGVKLRGRYDSTPLVQTNDFTLSGSGATAKYIGYPSFNTEELNEAFGIDDSETNDVAVLDLMGEISWTEPTTEILTSSETFSVRVNNDVNREDDAPPNALPSPSDWLDARAVRFDKAQTLTDAQKQIARGNTGAETAGAAALAQAAAIAASQPLDSDLTAYANAADAAARRALLALAPDTTGNTNLNAILAAGPASSRTAIDAARLSAANSFGGLQKLAIPGPFATDAEANTFGVPDDNLYYRSDGTVRAASHISLDLAFALDKTLTARVGPTPTFSRASSGLFVNANGILVGKTAGTTDSINPSAATIGTTQVTVTVASGSVVGWLVGQSVSLIVDTDGGNDNDASELWLVGTIVSTTATQLVFTVTEKTATAGSQTAWTLGYRGARFDHDPATGVCKGLLIEEPRTNLVLRSEEFDNSYWSKDNATVGDVDVVVAPNSALTADKLVATTSLSRHSLIRAIGVGASNSSTVSCYAKAGGYGFLAMSVIQVANSDGILYTFNLTNGTTTQLVTGAYDNISASAQSVGNGWWRCSITFTNRTTSADRLIIAPSPSASPSLDGLYKTPSYAGDGTSGIYLWGAQVEVGAFPTSYIPTTIGTAARSADVCSIIGTDFSSFYNQVEGTIFASSSMFAPLVGASRRVVTISDGTTANRNSIANIIPGFIEAGLTQVFFASSGGNAQAALGVQSLTLTSLNRTVGAYKVNDFAASTNGSAAVTDTDGLVVASVNRLEIGNQLTVDFLCGHIARIQYFRKRLSNAKLQTITAP